MYSTESTVTCARRAGSSVVLFDLGSMKMTTVTCARLVGVAGLKRLFPDGCGELSGCL